jgi:hypothetical protein
MVCPTHTHDTPGRWKALSRRSCGKRARFEVSGSLPIRPSGRSAYASSGQVTGQALKEAQAINKSLSALGDVLEGSC